MATETQKNYLTDSDSPFNGVYANIGSYGGFFIGLWYANTQKSGFWGYVGWALLFGGLGRATGTLVQTISKQ